MVALLRSGGITSSASCSAPVEKRFPDSGFCTGHSYVYITSLGHLIMKFANKYSGPSEWAIAHFQMKPLTGNVTINDNIVLVYVCLLKPS